MGPMRVLAFGTYDIRRHPRVGVLVEGLREHGDEVREVVVPLDLDTAARVALLRQPWRLPLLAWRLLRSWARLSVAARAAVRSWTPDAVLVGYLGHFDVVLARLLFPRTRIVLDHLVFAADTAADRRQTGRARRWVLGRLDRGAIASADIVVLDTAEHAALMPGPARGRAVVAPVGAGRSWFAGAADSGRDDSPVATDDGILRVVFFGLFTPLQGAPVIGRALALLADEPRIQVLMIGSGQDLQVTRAAGTGNPRVRWVPWVPIEELPRLVARHDVCLGIFGTTPKALRVVPNKVFQGAAAGCAIVTSGTGPQRAALASAAEFVPPGDPVALAEALRRLADDGERLTRLRRASAERADRSFAPSAVVTELRARLVSPTTHPVPR
jgi:glycosyltransferase involved in cell wall biosynthesis